MPGGRTRRLQALTDPERRRYRAQVIQALASSADPADRREARKLRECQAGWMVAYPLGRPDEATPIPCHCDRALCPECAQHRTRDVRAFVEEALAWIAECEQRDWRRPSFLTLTQRGSAGESLVDARARFRKAWSRFRRRAWFKLYFRGGAVRIEETYNAKKGWWHVHLHAICWAKYVPKHELFELQRLWAECRDEVEPGGARLQGVDGDSISELVKYPFKSAGVPADKVVEWAQASRGYRSISTFGEWHGRALNGKALGSEVRAAQRARRAVLADERGVRLVTPLSQVERLAAAGDIEAVVILAAVDREIAQLERRHSGKCRRRRARRQARRCRPPPQRLAA